MYFISMTIDVDLSTLQNLLYIRKLNLSKIKRNEFKTYGNGKNEENQYS